MISSPSLSDFGTHDESAYPELWRGCVGAWAPCLGPTGLRLHDLSRYRNWGTLTNMDAATDWVVSGGRYALDFDAVDDNIIATGNAINGQGSNLGGLPEMSLVLWARRNASNTQFIAATDTLGGSNTINIAIWSDGNVYFQNSNFFPSISYSGTEWNCWVQVLRNSRILGYRNGVSVLDAAGPSTVATQPGGYTIGFYRPATSFSNGQFSEFRVYNRALSPAETRTISLRPGIAYERRKRQSVFFNATFFNPAWARNSNVIVSPVGAA